MNLHSCSSVCVIVGFLLLCIVPFVRAENVQDASRAPEADRATEALGRPDPDIDALVRAEQTKFNELYSSFTSIDIARNEAGLGAALERYLAKAPASEWERHQHFHRAYTVCRVLAERGEPRRAILLGERLAQRLAQERHRGGVSDELAEFWSVLEADVWMDVLHDIDGAAAVLDAPGGAWSDRQGMIAQRRERVSARDQAQIAQTLAGELLRERQAAEERAQSPESE